MTDTIGFGLLGSGMIASYHARAVAASADLGARLVTVSDVASDRFPEISGKFGVECVLPSEMLANPDVNVVCVCTPSGNHAQDICTAALAGKHVLVEKPLALTLADADAAIATCAKHQVKLGVVLQRRLDPVFRAVKEAIDKGDLGELTLGVATMPYYRTQEYYAQATWRGTWALDGGGVLMNQGIHVVDLLLWYFGDPVEVQARAVTLHHPIEVEDAVVATLRFANGAMATLAATTSAAPGHPHRIEVYGTRGAVQVEGETIVRWGVAKDDRGTVPPPPDEPIPTPGAACDPRGISPEGHMRVVRDFVQAVRLDQQPVSSGEEGRRSLAAVLAVYRAAGILPTRNPVLISAIRES